MEKETAALIEKLAAKLGTTTEYLWRVLIKQAPISACIDVVFILGWIIFCFALYRIHRHLMAELPEPKQTYGRENLYAIHEGSVAFPMIIGAFVAAVWGIVSAISISSIITALTNPEYWALQQILTTL